jgi:hypothetical protein
MACGINNSRASVSKDVTKEESRFEDLTKSDIFKACWLSYQDGLDQRDTVHLLAVGVSDDTLAWLKSTTKAKVIVEPMRPMREFTPPYGEHPYKQYHEVGVNHFIPQYEYFVDLVNRYPDDLYYLANDDYLHVPNAVSNIKKLFIEHNYDGFLVPQDYPDTNLGYFRTINSSTPHLVAKGTTWRKFSFDLLKTSVFADDMWTYKAFNKVQAVSPMPGWATHLQKGCISPYVDWYSLAKEILSKAP